MTGRPVSLRASARNRRPSSLQTLKAVGRGAGLERAAAQNSRATFLDRARDGEELFAAFDRAGSADERHRGIAADAHPANLHGRGRAPEFIRGKLVRLVHGNDRFDPGHGGEWVVAHAILRPNNANDDAGSAAADLGLEPAFAHARHDPLDLLFGGVRLSDNDHGAPSGNTIMSPGTAKCKPRGEAFSAGL